MAKDMIYDTNRMPKLSKDISLTDVSLLLCCDGRQDYAVRLNEALWKDGNNANHLVNSYVTKNDGLYYIVGTSRIGKIAVGKYAKYLEKFKIGRKNIVKFSKVDVIPQITP